MIRISNISYPIEMPEERLIEYIVKKYKIKNIKAFEISKKSIDAKNTILKIIHKFSSSDLVCFITYGSTVKVGQVKKMSNFNTEKLLNIDDLNDNACFYDALQILKQSILGGNLSDEMLYIMDYNDDGKVKLYDALKFLQQAILE